MFCSTWFRGGKVLSDTSRIRYDRFHDPGFSEAFAFAVISSDLGSDQI